MEEAYGNPLEEQRNWAGVTDGFPGQETTIYGEDEGVGAANRTGQG